MQIYDSVDKLQDEKVKKATVNGCCFSLAE